MFCETVVLLSKGMVDSRKVKVDFPLEDMDLSEFKGKATYEQINPYPPERSPPSLFCYRPFPWKARQPSHRTYFIARLLKME